MVIACRTCFSLGAPCPSHRPQPSSACACCRAPIQPADVLVYYDPSGRDGPITTPAHLSCFLEAADLSLPSNAALVNFMAEQAASIIRRYYFNR